MPSKHIVVSNFEMFKEVVENARGRRGNDQIVLPIQIANENRIICIEGSKERVRRMI
jgi:hypothetical protein